MRDDIAVIGCTFVAADGRLRQLSNLAAWRGNLHKQGIYPTLIECVFDGREPVADADIVVRASHPIWAKENLLNIAARSLPDKITKVVWSDCDVLWDDPNWLNELSEKLETDRVVQAFNTVVELGRTGQGKHEPWATASPDRFTSKLTTGRPGNRVGVAWSAQRELFEKFGLYDKCILGSGDTVHTHLGFMGKPARRRLTMTREPGQPTMFPDGLVYDAVSWAAKVSWWVDSKVGCGTTRARRLYHGDGEGRAYNKRYFGIQRDFDPTIHTHLNDDGVIQFNSDRVLEINHARNYFENRNEDKGLVVREGSPEVLIRSEAGGGADPEA